MADEPEKTLFVRKNEDGRWCFDTYFNAFDCEGWSRYSRVECVSLSLRCEHPCRVRLWHLDLDKAEPAHTVQELMEEVSCQAVDEVQVIGPFQLPASGIFAFEVMTDAAYNVCPITKAAWITPQEIKQTPVEIGIGICTFKREAYVQRNLKRLREELLEDSEALGYGHIRVCVSDNGRTLTPVDAEDAQIRILPNKNLGGVGGFTRTMMEHMHSDVMPTHILLMDDDAVIFPASVERTWSLLSVIKPEYRSHVICGSLFREDLPGIQTESGARWHRGDVESLGANIDMTDVANVISESREREIEYSGWWYSCIPVSQILTSGLPLPLFIHRDDIEFGLRAAGFIRLSGICVRHEAFDNKMPGTMEYYDIRNLGIVNAMHYEDYSVREFDKQLLIMVLSNLVKFRYRYAMMNLKGAADFLKGAEAFLKKDGEAYHLSLKPFNYEMLSDEETRQLVKKYQAKDFRTEAFKAKQQAGRMKRIRSLLTLNGTFFPAADRKPVVTVPWPELSSLYKKRCVIYVDNNEHACIVKKSPMAAIRVCVKTLRMLWLSGKYFDKACASWRAYKTLMTSEDYWKQILGL